MKNAITWFEIGTSNLARATAFYEAVLGQKMRLENMGPSDRKSTRLNSSHRR